MRVITVALCWLVLGTVVVDAAELPLRAAIERGVRDMRRSQLRGLDGLWVIPMIVKPDDIAGLSPRDLTNIVELELRRAGITVFETLPLRDEPIEAGIVRINVLSCSGEATTAYRINLEVSQWVALERDPSVRFLAATWHSVPVIGFFGSASRPEVVRKIGDYFQREARTLANDYLAANPRPSSDQ